jgi:hypothetical protein
VAYSDDNGIPGDTLARLTNLGNTNKTLINLGHPDLLPNKLLQINSSITTTHNAKLMTPVLSVRVPSIAGGKLFCGPCQLYAREKCIPFNGICWTDYENVAGEVFFNEPECLKAMAKECYAIWKVNGTADFQCADFVRVFDFEKMRGKPKVLDAAYAADGSVIIISFNMSMRQTELADCSTIFKTSTLNFLPDSKVAKWMGPNTLHVDYDPSKGIAQALEFTANSLYPDYLYAQEALDAATVTVSIINDRS